MTISTRLKGGPGRLAANHNKALQVRSTLKAGAALISNHSESLQIRSTLKAGALRRKIRTGSQEDRLRLLVVRAGLKAGKMRLAGRSYARNRL
jgi:hypothetical protein